MCNYNQSQNLFYMPYGLEESGVVIRLSVKINNTPSCSLAKYWPRRIASWQFFQRRANNIFWQYLEEMRVHDCTIRYVSKLIKLEKIVLEGTSTADTLDKLGSSDVFKELVVWLTNTVIDSPDLMNELASLNNTNAIPIIRRLRSCYSPASEICVFRFGGTQHHPCPLCIRGYNGFQE